MNAHIDTRFLLRLPVWLAMALAILLAGCAPRQEDASVPRDECGPVEPGQDDVDFALSFGKPAFASPDWIKTYTVAPYKITLTRNNGVVGGVNYLEYLMFNCGYGQSDLDSYFTNENFDIIFQDYESHSYVTFCENDDQNLALYKFDLMEEGIPYQARYWVSQASDTRLLIAMLVFPSDAPDLMADYSGKIFPNFTDCK